MGDVALGVSGRSIHLCGQGVEEIAGFGESPAACGRVSTLDCCEPLGVAACARDRGALRGAKALGLKRLIQVSSIFQANIAFVTVPASYFG